MPASPPKYTFQYKPGIQENPLTKEKEIVYRPFISIDIAFEGKWLSEETKGHIAYVDALIDSGADHNYAPATISRILHVPMQNYPQQKVFGISGRSSRVRFVPVSIRLRNAEFSTEIGFGGEISEPVLGNSGFFKFWEVSLKFPTEIMLARLDFE